MDPLIYYVTFTTIFANFSQDIKNYSSVNISSLNNFDFNYSFSFDNNLTKSNFYLKLKTNDNFANRPNLVYLFNVSDLFLLKNNLTMPIKTASIILKPYYPMSESEKSLAASINSQTKSMDSTVQGVGYASTFFSSCSSLFVNGLLLVEMIFLLKFVEISYPPMVIQMFESRTSSPKLLFDFTFINNPSDSLAVPQLFQHYNVSVYFLNNVGEIVCEMGLLIFIATILLKITPYDEENNEEGKLRKILKKVLIFVRNALVWESSLFFILMNLQKIIFFIASSCIFPPTTSMNAYVNVFFSSIFGFAILIWFIHFFKIIDLCQKFKQEKGEPSIKNEANENNQSIFSAKSNNKSQIFPFQDSPLISSSTSHDKNFPINFKKNIVESPTKQENRNIFSHIHYDLPNLAGSLNQIDIDMTSTKCFSNINKKTEGLISRLKKQLISFLYQPKNPNVYLQRYDLLHLDYKSTKSIQKYYEFFYYFRQCWLSVLAVILHRFPFCQIITLNVFNIIFILFTIFSRPFTTMYSYITCLVNELITESAFLASLLLGFYDFFNETDYQKRMKCGWLIVYANMFLLYWVIFTGVLRPIVFWIYEKQKQRNLVKIHSDSS